MVHLKIERTNRTHLTDNCKKRIFVVKMSVSSPMGFSTFALVLVIWVSFTSSQVAATCTENQKIFCFASSTMECAEDCSSSALQLDCGEDKIFCSTSGTCVDLEEQCAESCPQGTVWCPSTGTCCTETQSCGDTGEVWCATSASCTFPGLCPEEVQCQYGYCAETQSCKTTPYDCPEGRQSS